MSKRLWSLLLTVCLVFLSAPALCEQAEQPLMTMAGFDGTNTYRAWDSCAFFSRMAELTGINFAFQQAETAEKWEQAKENMQPGQGLPDVLFKADLSVSQMKRMYEKGVLMDLAPLLESCCPNLWKILSEHPEYLEGIRLPGGQITALPFISTAPAQNAMWINRTWLNRLKLDEPMDRESLEAVLTAFKTRDPNQNGRADEIPLSFLGPFDLKFLAHMFGIVANDYNLFVDEDNQVHFAPQEPAYRDFVAWCADMYKQGLLDRDGFYLNDTLRQVTSTSQAQTYGVVLNTELTNLFPAEWVADYEIMMPLVYEGAQRYRSLTGNLYLGTFALTTACADPEKALRWVDTLYTMEGAKLMAVGKENADYVVDGDGTWRILDAVSQNSSFISTHLIVSGSTPPGISADAFELSYSDKNLAEMVRGRMRLNEYCVRPTPYYDLTDAQKARISELQQAIGYAVDMQIARFVLGEDQLTDETWDQFLDSLEKLGLPEFLQIWQEVFEEVKS